MQMWVMIGVGVLLAAYVVVSFNRLVTLRFRMRDAWSQIDVQLKRRYDLIPNLVNAVKGYMDHERSTLEAVTRARQQAMAAGAGSDVNARAAAESALSFAASKLMGLVEAYPALRASENMLALQEELASTENRIAFARQFYNDTVMEYNTARGTFPRNLLAGPFGFRPAQMFTLDDPGHRAAPQVHV
jgi:LemA protein